MQRVLILGPSGAGKSALAGALGDATGLPVVHLDPLFWRGDWSPLPREQAEAELARAVAGDSWIVDGNFLAVEAGRFERADTIVLLDLPRRTCLRRTLWRRARDRGRSRPDLPAGAREGIDLASLRWVWGYRSHDRPQVLARVAELGDRVAFHHLRSARAARSFLAAVV